MGSKYIVAVFVKTRLVEFRYIIKIFIVNHLLICVSGKIIVGTVCPLNMPFQT